MTQSTFPPDDSTPPVTPGTPLPPQPANFAATTPPASYSSAPLANAGQHSFLVTWLFAWILGYLGVDRFYLGKIGTGILKLITLGGFGLWYLIDLIIVLVGSTRDKQGQPLAGYQEKKAIAWIVTLGVWILGGISAGLTFNSL